MLNQNSMNSRKYQMVDECVDKFQVEELPDGRAQISILVPKRFADLWITKINSLETTDEEINEYES